MIAKTDAWLAKALTKLHACQLLPELPDLAVRPKVRPTPTDLDLSRRCCCSSVGFKPCFDMISVT